MDEGRTIEERVAALEAENAALVRLVLELQRFAVGGRNHGDQLTAAQRDPRVGEARDALFAVSPTAQALAALARLA